VNERVDGRPRTGIGVGVAVGVVAGVAVAAGVAVGVPDGAGVEVGVVAGTPPVLLLVPPLQPHSSAARTAAVADIVDSLGDTCTRDPSS
jgi:hypothetical protein